MKDMLAKETISETATLSTNNKTIRRANKTTLSNMGICN